MTQSRLNNSSLMSTDNEILLTIDYADIINNLQFKNIENDFLNKTPFYYGLLVFTHIYTKFNKRVAFGAYFCTGAS
jgi:hypothetical protein